MDNRTKNLGFNEAGVFNLSEANLRVHTASTSNLPKSALDDRIRSWASNVSIARSGGDISPNAVNTEAGRQSGADVHTGSNEMNEDTGHTSLSKSTHHKSMPTLASHPTNIPTLQPNARPTPTGSHTNLRTTQSHGLSSTTHIPQSTLTQMINSQSGSADRLYTGASRSTHSLVPQSTLQNMIDSQPRSVERESNPMTWVGNEGSREKDGKKPLCSLKIEIEKGVYKMLDVYDNDAPDQLSRSFCHENGLPNWVDSLEKHIRGAKRSFGAA